MIIKETENKELPTIILLHGGGLSWWSLKPIIEQLKMNFHVVTPIIEGHGEAGKDTFVSIENYAHKLIEFIDKQYNGKIFAIGGLSIGAQIVTEIISFRNDITEYAIIESALIYPIKGMTFITVPTYKLFYGLIKKRWFSKLQAKTLCVPKNMFEQYYDESLKITKESLINITLSNGNYCLNDSICHTKAKVLVIVGEKELRIMKKSSLRLHELIADSELYIAPHMGHGGISLLYPEKYVALITNFFKKKK
ncbi:alpha/beta hydrolase [Anaerocolumna cellulosilytica]|uniref:Alpha/beta hydrolase n=1 Tax=Anaerocolumna cellulosilytica TaxID=433286 RepID=A0A6S6R5U8_9FIRM|nr:alpha/beta hydrolase [Anaerocolumna cellulosilytica]MBB5194089.1 pimeloyl-ACP methyl ester carboxylesterase [Anaerocolumna cellulosilytica]BCJ94695.1 alpha/beta hydrolase [Anaerocolumna cellulosilytica]